MPDDDGFRALFKYISYSRRLCSALRRLLLVDGGANSGRTLRRGVTYLLGAGLSSLPGRRWMMPLKARREASALYEAWSVIFSPGSAWYQI
jgi:hypothetical protein